MLRGHRALDQTGSILFFSNEISRLTRPLFGQYRKSDSPASTHTAGGTHCVRLTPALGGYFVSFANNCVTTAIGEKVRSISGFGRAVYGGELLSRALQNIPNVLSAQTFRISPSLCSTLYTRHVALVMNVFTRDFVLFSIV